MFSVGDTVVYGTQGVCTIKEISLLKLGRAKGEYYILTPVAEPGSVVYVPTSNEKLLGKMRAVLSREEADALILDAVREPMPWISDDASRKVFCDDVVKNGSRRELMRLVGMLYRHREELRLQKKHFHNVDAQYLKAAERLLHDELAYALSIPTDQVSDYIHSRLAGSDPR
nr:MAG TPA: Transcriptional regulator [Caudoviricetes sp.]